MECKKCKGTGWYKYDYWHSKPCEVCCKHDKGSWLLTEYHSHTGEWCCLGGCGKHQKEKF